MATAHSSSSLQDLSAADLLSLDNLCEKLGPTSSLADTYRYSYFDNASDSSSNCNDELHELCSDDLSVNASSIGLQDSSYIHTQSGKTETEQGKDISKKQTLGFMLKCYRLDPFRSSEQLIAYLHSMKETVEGNNTSSDTTDTKNYNVATPTFPSLNQFSSAMVAAVESYRASAREFTSLQSFLDQVVIFIIN